VNLSATLTNGYFAGPENDLFSGEYWTGRRGLELGLVDSIGEVRSTLRDRFMSSCRWPGSPASSACRRRFGPASRSAAFERKAMLDPFLPEKPDDVERLKELQREIHADFIALVKSRRGGKL
jgi:ClpP class serine protease